MDATGNTTTAAEEDEKIEKFLYNYKLLIHPVFNKSLSWLPFTTNK